MRICLVLLAALSIFGAVKLPVEHALSVERTRSGLSGSSVDVGAREQVGQLGLAAALGGFRSVVADLLFIQAHVAWERTQWSRVELLFRGATALQPHSILFWDMAAWHMAWNASAAALQNPAEPRFALRVKAQREYFDIGKHFLEHGIRNNPDRPQLYEALARLYRDKYNDHARAAEFFAKAAAQNGAPTYARRFAAYELSYCSDHEREAYQELRRLYDASEQERLPTLIRRLKFLEERLNVPLDQRIPDAAR
jgi:hypothetical protein